jgi:hypothetical protein
MGQLRAQLLKTQERVAEIDSERHRLLAVKVDLLEQIGLGKQELAQIVEKCKLSDHRCDSLARQITALVKKESEMIQERKRVRKWSF